MKEKFAGGLARVATQSDFDNLGFNEHQIESLLRTAWQNDGYVPIPHCPGAKASSGGIWKRSQLESQDRLLLPLRLIHENYLGS